MTHSESALGAPRNHSAELAACEELLTFAKSKLHPWSGNPRRRVHDGILMAEGARATKSYQAAVALCGLGFGEQAAMLNRSIFEGSLAAHWVADHPEEAARLFERHQRDVQVRWVDKLTRLGWADNLELPEPASARERRELQDLFGAHGQKLWTGHRNLHHLAGAVEHHWPGGRARDEWREFIEAPYHEANLILHTGSSALSRTATLDPEGGPTLNFDIGPSDQYVGPALYAAMWTYSQTLTLLMDEFEISGRAAFNDLFVRLRTAFDRTG